MATRTESPQRLETWQLSADTLLITVLDEDGNAVDITGLTLRFVAHDANDPATGEFQVADGSISKGGANKNEATVSVTPTETANSMTNGHWELWNITGGEDVAEVIANGSIIIKVAVKTVA